MLDPKRPVYVFDTCGLIDFFAGKTQVHDTLLRILLENGQYLYHPISLAELADYIHPEIWRQRQDGNLGDEEIRRRIKARRHLITLLATHRTKPNTRLVAGRRFRPFHVDVDLYLNLARQRGERGNIRKLPKTGRHTVVADLTDHEILAIAILLKEKKYTVTFVSADHDLLGAAARLKVPWVNTRSPRQSDPFPWE